MSHRNEIDAILRQLHDWPAEDRIALANQILQRARGSALAATPRNTFEAALGIGRGAAPPPSDEEVRRMVHEHRMGKYAG